MDLIKRLCEMLRLMVGVPDYQRYVTHLRQHHPDEPVPTEGEFVARCQKARYEGGKQSRCC